MDIKTVISEKLNEIERKENVRILHCVESGSRAWGFESPDSDYDVRFIYVRPKDYYLKLESTRDVIEWQLDDTLDINGWDIQKIDMGIAMCHFVLGIEEKGMTALISVEDPGIIVPDDTFYIASFNIR